jgi:hypothetical protein
VVEPRESRPATLPAAPGRHRGVPLQPRTLIAAGRLRAGGCRRDSQGRDRHQVRQPPAAEGCRRRAHARRSVETRKPTGQRVLFRSASQCSFLALGHWISGSGRPAWNWMPLRTKARRFTA